MYYKCWSLCRIIPKCLPIPYPCFMMMLMQMFFFFNIDHFEQLREKIYIHWFLFKQNPRKGFILVLSTKKKFVEHEAFLIDNIHCKIYLQFVRMFICEVRKFLCISKNYKTLYRFKLTLSSTKIIGYISQTVSLNTSIYL